MQSIIAFFVRRGLLVNLVSLMLLVGGIYAALSIQREAFPSVNFDVIVVSAAWPGAAPSEVERQMLDPIEQELKGIDGIDEIHSTAYPGLMQITVKVDPSFSDRSRLVADIQQGINRAQLPLDLPADPMITEVKSEQAPVLSVTLFADMDPLTLKRVANDVQDDLLNLKGVSRVLLQGGRKEEIRIVLNPDKMARNRVSINDVRTLIQGWNINAPGGHLQLPQGQQVLRITGELTGADDAAQLVLRANDRGDLLKLGDVADISTDLVRPTRLIAAMGKPAINMIILKKGDADIISLVDRVKGYLTTVPNHYQVEVRTYNDFSLITRLRLGVLTSNGAIGLALVLLVLSLFLRPGVALTTAWGLPIIFFSGLLALYFGGVTLNLLTMFGFIMVLGLMVDDAIIIGENVTWHMEQGVKPEQAAIIGTFELLGPVTATVLTTVVAFLPLMHMDGIIGKFIYSIPVVVVILLSFSWLEAIFILPNHIRDVVNAKKKPKERKLFVTIVNLYGTLLTLAVRWRYITILLTLMGFAATLLLASQMKFQLFPSGAESQFYLRVNAPIGTTLEENYQLLSHIDQAVRERIDPQLLETTTLIAGENSADQRETMKQVGDRFGFVRAILIPFTERKVSAYTVMARIQNEVPQLFPQAKISFAMMKPGPPVGRAFQVELSGGDAAARREVAQRLMAQLQQTAGALAIESDLEGGDPELRVVLDRAKAAYAGINLATVSLLVKAAFDGLRVSTIRQTREESDVTIRYPISLQQDITTLMQLEIPNTRGGLIPLGYIAHLEKHDGATSIRHKDGRRIVNVSAEVDPEVITSKELNTMMKKMQAKWLGTDKAVHIHFGGEQERSEESVRSLIFSFVFALFGIFIILAIQFNSITYPVLVMLAIPFGLIGIVIGFFLHGEPLSFMAMMGFVALTGVVVNNSLVMAVFFQRLIAQGLAWREAVVESGKRRLRAVLLTALTTVVGLLPTAYGWGGFDPFVAPMALALSWGLLFSTVITLFSIPAAFGLAQDVKGLFQQKKP
ncbi:MAG: efflux RND transporter permease subunit [Mariprofundales bacterium]